MSKALDSHFHLDSRLVDWLNFYKELGLTPVFRGASATRATRAKGGEEPSQKSLQAPSGASMKPRKPNLPNQPSQKPSTTPTPVPAVGGGPASSASLFGGPEPERNESLPEIAADIGDDCTRCKLHEGRTNLVFGSGNPQAKVVFVGEGPGADEDAQGLPFVGRAGRLLTKWIESIGMTRDEVYICNVVKCRPPGNRAPQKDEIETCSPFLYRQIEVIGPKLICCLGATALKALLGKTLPIGKMRGKLIEFHGTQMLPLYHPAYLLRPHPKQVDDDLKRDLQQILQVLDS